MHKHLLLQESLDLLLQFWDLFLVLKEKEFLQLQFLLLPEEYVYLQLLLELQQSLTLIKLFIYYLEVCLQMQVLLLLFYCTLQVIQLQIFIFYSQQALFCLFMEVFFFLFGLDPLYIFLNTILINLVKVKLNFIRKIKFLNMDI